MSRRIFVHSASPIVECAVTVVADVVVCLFRCEANATMRCNCVVEFHHLVVPEFAVVFVLDVILVLMPTTIIVSSVWNANSMVQFS